MSYNGGSGLSRGLGSGSLAVRPGTGVPRIDIGSPVDGMQDVSDADHAADGPKEFTDEDGNVFMLVSKSEFAKFKRAQRIVKKDKDGSFILDSCGLKKWSDKAIMSDQFQRPGMFMMDAPRTDVFDLGETSKLHDYNELLSRTYPVECPSVVIHEAVRKFYKGRYILLVTWSQVWYLLPERKK